MQQVDDVYREGKQGRPAASPTSVLEEDPLVVGSWSMWDLSLPIDSPSVSHHASPIRTSPLRSSMSSPLRDAMHLTSKRGAEGNNNSNSAGSRSLVETLQNCLTSLPQSTNMGDSVGRSLSDPNGAPSSATTSRQLSSRPPGKRRPRASRRTPTTILETNPSEFKDMVQKLTGIPSATPAGVPVRPQPQRASANHLVRPETLRSIRRLPPISSPPRPPITPAPITVLQHSQQNNTSPVLAAMTPTALKREFPEESSSSPLYGSYESVMKRAMSAPTTSMESWWSDNDKPRGPSMTNLNPELPFTMSSGDALTNAILSAASGTTASPDYARLDSADGQLAQEEQEFAFAQIEIESWLSAQDHASAESMCG
ncbi:hypothetical protein KC19_12G167600 [Ceratodon purpureus]|uniref:VQ domain-containing protein n=1 Tax=Ceratodon purpureus TaxID=3225 RepID=A0A8T0G831_CERPU|nr:hypothetical protein KC19_12G167600 [Ceratodon purpureus]